MYFLRLFILDRMQQIIVSFVVGLLSFAPVFSQGKFVLKDDRKKDKIKFELINNMIILPVKINGVELSFLLDTGVSTVVILNLEEIDSLDLRNARKTSLRGLGGDEVIEAVHSENNVMEIGNTINKDLSLHLIYDESFNFSPRLGYAVHGILGYDFFKDFIVEINYERKYLKVHDPQKYRSRLRRYREVPLKFYRNKPYVELQLEIEDKQVGATLLVDNGLGDAIWLFPDKTGIFKVPQESFHDFLGLGLIGDVHGQRSRITSLSLGGHKLENVIGAFPDSTAVAGLKLFEERHGSLGAEILRRFNLVFDYGGKRMFVKKNSNFNKPFHYNMSGIVLEHRGYVVVETHEMLVSKPTWQHESVPAVVAHAPSYKKYELQPDFQIVKIRENSPAARVGLLVGDRVVSINNKRAYKYTMEEIASLFASRDGKNIKIEVEREGKELVFRFELEELL